MLISIRGTNGSGKSHVIHQFFAACKGQKAIYGLLGERLPEAYVVQVPKCKTPTFVLGPYTMAGGGCDRIIPYDNIPKLINKYATKGHVIFEGIIVTSVYGQVGALMEKHKKNSVFLFLDTPLEECIKRVEFRRGYERDARLVRNLTAKYTTAQRIKEKVTTEKLMQVMSASSGDAHKAIIKLLQKAG